MGESSSGTPQIVKTLEDRLDSWKEIAAYLHRDVTTVQRWEKREGMPVHRHQHDRMGSVYGFSSELDAWLHSRRLRLEAQEKEKEKEEEKEDLRAKTAVGREPESASGKILWRWLMVGVLVLALAAVVAYVIKRRNDKASALPKITTLAVLPLKNLSGDASQEYLADGMTEALIGRLSRIHDLRVISRTSVMRFKDTQVPVPEIAKTLGVDAIVEGSVIRENNRIRVNAQLIRGATDEHFWSEAYDGDLRDALALQSEVAQSIARKVEVTVTGEERARLVAARHVSPEVYESFLKGEFALDKSNSKAGMEESVRYFEDAIRKDPSFAPAYVGLAAAYGQLGNVFAGVSPAELRPKVMTAARRALELDPELGEAHVLLAGVHQEQWQWAEVESEYKRALELNPNNAAAQGGFAVWLLC